MISGQVIVQQESSDRAIAETWAFPMANGPGPRYIVKQPHLDESRTMTPREILLRLGRGEPIADVCAAAGWSRATFDAFWQAECRKRLSTARGETTVRGLRAAARITRDARGVPHVEAGNDRDLFFAFGYAVAQDRLFQLDYLRRQAHGTLAEILGPQALPQDVLARTIGLGSIARRELATLGEEVRELLGAYSDGISAWISAAADNLPIEYDLLDYRPAPWSPTDTLAIIGEFRWYLTGRFPIIAVPELVKRALGDGPLYRDFVTAEADEEAVLFPGEYATTPRWEGDPGGSLGGEAGGSNNWVLAGPRTASGRPLLASDPHIPYYAVSIWHEVHLRGGSFNVAGVALAGMPAIMIGRNLQVAWGITNNICSQRDLYQEKIDPAHPGCYLHGQEWEPWQERTEEIQVRGPGGGMDTVRRKVRSSRHGPIVDDLLPAEARHTGPVSLRWLGTEPCGWLEALVGMNRAGDVHAFREAGRPWSVPTFNLVFADVEGNIAFQTFGRIPLRKKRERAYRPGWDPEHEWQGFIPFDKLPGLINPARGYVSTANNRVAADDFPYPLSGCWATGHRQGRIRERMQSQRQWNREDCRQLQMDTYSRRAALGLPALLEQLRGSDDLQTRQAALLLSEWNLHVDVNSVPASLFNVFFQHWCKTVTRERLPADQAALAAGNAVGLAARLLQEDPHGWFAKTPREQALRAAFAAALDELTTRLGPDMSTWTWGRLHGLSQKHFLSSRGELGALLDLPRIPACGDGVTVCAGTFDGNYQAWLGAGYRMVADLADPQCGIWSVEVAGASGQPGSLHYADQVEPWSAGRLVYMPLVGTVDGDILTLKVN
jgi:penicillin amidase